MTAATANYFSDQDLFGQWLAEECDREPGNNYKSEKNGDLFASWKLYADRAGDHPGSQKSFSAMMARRGFEAKRTKASRMFLGFNCYPSKGGIMKKGDG